MTFVKVAFLSMLFVMNIYSADNLPVTVRSCFGAGFFAELRRVLFFIGGVAFNDTHTREVRVEWNDAFFPYKNGKNENGWDLFFGPIGQVENKMDVHSFEVIHDHTCLNKWLSYDEFYPYRMGMNALIKKYIKINQNILEELDGYCHVFMLNAICIGVHVRFATAHGAEKPGTVRLHDYFSEIDVLIKKLERMQRQYVIYLATDSNYVVEAFRKRYSRFLLYRDTIRSAYAEEVHLISERSDYWLAHVQEFHDKKPGYKGGKDVLLDCLILSRCDYLVHTTSNVSDFATFFNPTIQSIFIPKQIDPNKKRDCAACRVPDKWYDHEIF